MQIVLPAKRRGIYRLPSPIAHKLLKKAKAKALKEKIKELEAERVLRWNARQSHLERLHKQTFATREELEGSLSWKRVREISKGIAETEQKLTRAKNKLAAARKGLLARF